jgi:3-oxoadipate enol-lactonase
MPYLKANDISIYYEVRGDGEPLLLLMGLGGGSSMWWQQMDLFSHWYQVVAFDSRGVGRSDKPDTAYSMDMLAKDALAVVNGLNLAPAKVYGLSMGGMVAQELALNYPDAVSGLVLGATFCGGVHSVTASRETINQLFNLLNLPLDDMVRVLTALTFSDSFAAKHPKVIEEWMAKGAEAPPSPQDFKRQAEATTRFDTYERLPQIKVPTLVIAGTGDRLIPVENSRILASRIPNAELVLLQGAGHGYLWEAAEDANRAVLNFLKRHRRKPLRPPM